MAKTLTRDIAAKKVARDQGLATFQSNVMLLMAAGLLLTGIIDAIVTSNPTALSYLLTIENGKPTQTGLWWILSMAELVLVFSMAGWELSDEDVSVRTGLTKFFVYAALNGLTIAPLLSMFTNASVFRVTAFTAAAFGGCALYGLLTKRNLSAMGSFFLMGLLGLIVLMIANSFMHSPTAALVIPALGILLFAGLTAYDMQKLTDMYDSGRGRNGLAILGALALYLDFLNLFMFFLQFGGSRKD